MKNSQDSGFVIKQREVQADEMGSVYTFIVGYNPLNIGSKLISTIINIIN
jgi:hypothetical protein